MKIVLITSPELGRILVRFVLQRSLIVSILRTVLWLHHSIPTM